MAITLFPKRWAARPPMGTQLELAHPLADRLVCALLLNEGGGTRLNLTRVLDSVNGRHSALFQGATPAVWAAGKDGPALSVVATSQMTPANPDDFNSLQATMAMWFRTSTVASAALAARAFPSHSWGMRLVTPDNFSARVITTGGSPAANFFTSGVINDRWHLGVITLDDTAKIVRGYLDGVRSATTLPYTGTFTVPGGSVNLTGSALGLSAYTGLMGPFYFWNRILSFEEIIQLYVEPYAMMRPQTPAKRYWFPFPIAPASNPITGTPWADVSGSGWPTVQE